MTDRQPPTDQPREIELDSTDLLDQAVIICDFYTDYVPLARDGDVEPHATMLRRFDAAIEKARQVSQPASRYTDAQVQELIEAATKAANWLLACAEGMTIKSDAADVAEEVRAALAAMGGRQEQGTKEG